MQTIAVGVEYDGAAYYGWQAQENVVSVQAALEAALAQVADQPIRVHTAGRTDRDVHAMAQVVHFTTTADRPMHAWVRGTNANLPGDIRVIWAQTVADDFHARFSATARRYQYLIANQPVKPGILRDCLSWHIHPLDVVRMQQGADHLVGTHDFTAYRALGCQAKTPIRTVHHLQIKRNQDLIVFDIKANAFLHHMVRNMVGVLIEIGEGKRPPEWAKAVLDGKDRALGGVTAKAQGLYLVQVDYPEACGLDNPARFPLMNTVT